MDAPIQHYYHWPCDRSLFKQVFEHTKVTAGFLTSNPRAYCLNDIGTMKTITALWAADYLMSLGVVRHAVIVAPIEALERAWGDTLFVHLTHRSFAVLHGSADKRRKLLAQPKDFYVINPDGLPVIKKELAARRDMDLYIIDELADFRNKTNFWKALDEILYPANRPPTPWVWGLTATPRPQRATDPYYQCRLVTPNTVPKYFAQFRAMVMSHESQYVWVDRPEAQQIIFQCMRPAIRFTRDECLDLPGEVYSALDAELSPEQVKHYKEIQRDLYTEIQGGRVTAVNEGVKRSKLLQIACGVVYDVDGVPREIDAGTRIEVLLRTIERTHEKVIVFVPFTEVTNTLYRRVAAHWSAAVVYGDVPKGERDQIFADFQQKDDPSV
ncbi:MAG: ATP-dependent helicase, partial [Burkholderiales bacterium]|nr:ATP-dependent helicase [Burkholderiales bacterium]